MTKNVRDLDVRQLHTAATAMAMAGTVLIAQMM
jgi:hypothetical protein